MNFDAFKKFIEQRLGKPLEACVPVAIPAEQAMEVLWPMNDVFKPHFEQIKSEPYSAAFEPAADEAISEFIAKQTPSIWDDLPIGVWRVLLERHMQSIMVLTLNEKTMAIPVPKELDRKDWLLVLMLFFLYEMKLPFPVADRSASEWDQSGFVARLRRH